MGKQDKIRGAQVRALSIFMRIKRIERETLNKVSTELQTKLSDLFDEMKGGKKLDRETIKQLKIYIDKKNEIEGAKEIFRDVINYVANKLHDFEQDGVSKTLLFLSPDGELYRKPKSEYCYLMTKSALRLKIIRFLIGKKNFIPREDIAKYIGTSNGYTAQAVRRINSISKNIMKLPENENLIISKNRGGYKLNPVYPITLE